MYVYVGIYTYTLCYATIMFECSVVDLNGTEHEMPIWNMQWNMEWPNMNYMIVWQDIDM